MESDVKAYHAFMDGKKYEILAGRVDLGVSDRFDRSIERGWQKGRCLGAAAILWASLPSDVRSRILTASGSPEDDLLFVLLAALGLDAARIVREAEARYEVHKQKPRRKTGEAG